MRRKLCILAIVSAMALTGCNNVPDLSKVDNDLAGQYMADALLKNEESYDGSLDYDHDVLSATPTPSPTPVKTPGATNTSQEQASNGQSDAGQNDDLQGASTQTNAESSDPGAKTSETEALQSVSVSEIFGVKGITIKPVGYRLVKSYGSSYANCTAAKGKKLLVVHFNIANKSGSTKKVNLSKAGVQAAVSIDGQPAGSAMLSIVDEDLQHLNTKIAAGKKKQGVLLFEVDHSQKIGEVSVNLTTGQKQAEVAVK